MYYINFLMYFLSWLAFIHFGNCLISCLKGDCEEHCTLLCSLLLGFGLEAYVCVGTKGKGVAHTWVMTCATDGAITFWESLTGQR